MQGPHGTFTVALGDTEAKPCGGTCCTAHRLLRLPRPQGHGKACALPQLTPAMHPSMLQAFWLRHAQSGGRTLRDMPLFTPRKQDPPAKAVAADALQGPPEKPKAPEENKVEEKKHWGSVPASELDPELIKKIKASKQERYNVFGGIFEARMKGWEDMKRREKREKQFPSFSWEEVVKGWEERDPHALDRCCVKYHTYSSKEPEPWKMFDGDELTTELHERLQERAEKQNKKSLLYCSYKSQEKRRHTSLALSKIRTQTRSPAQARLAYVQEIKTELRKYLDDARKLCTPDEGTEFRHSINKFLNEHQEKRAVVWMEKAVLHFVQLERAQLQKAGLPGAQLVGADLRGAQMQGAGLQETNFQAAFLEGTDFAGADLKKARMQGAYLKQARLQGANLEEADLSGADLTGAFLQGAELKNSCLRGAIFTDADLSGANFTNADLSGAEFKGAIWERAPNCAYITCCELPPPRFGKKAKPVSQAWLVQRIGQMALKTIFGGEEEGEGSDAEPEEEEEEQDDKENKDSKPQDAKDEEAHLPAFLARVRNCWIAGSL